MKQLLVSRLLILSILLFCFSCERKLIIDLTKVGDLDIEEETTPEAQEIMIPNEEEILFNFCVRLFSYACL